MPAQRPEDCDRLIGSAYTITGTGPDGKRISSSARGTEGVRCQADGTRRFVIDNPTRSA